jgi:hypothetical protein
MCAPALEAAAAEPARVPGDDNVKLALFQLFQDVWAIVDLTLQR